MNDALRILVVEDEILVARNLEATLKRLGFEVTGVCSTGEAALESIRRHCPQVVLMDIRLGSAMDGVETASRLRAEAALPVVFLTGLADEETLKRALTAEPYGCLLKPFDENELRSALELAYARNAAHTALQAHGDRLASTLRSMAEGLIATNLLGAVTFLNPVAEEITGWSQREAAGRPLREVFRVTLPNGEALGAAGLVMSARPESGACGPGGPHIEIGAGSEAGAGAGSGSGGRVENVKTRALRTLLLTDRSGRTIPIEEITTPIRDAGGSLSGIVIVLHRLGAADFSGQREAAGLLAESPDRAAGPAASLTSRPPPWPDLSGIVGSISDPLLAVDADWRITWLNALAAESLGGREEEMTGSVLWDCLPPSAHRQHYHAFSTALTRREAASLEMEHPSRGVWFSVQLYPFEGGLLALFRDITAQRRVEEDRRRIEKLENLGLLARGFAHDFNNLLTVLLGNLSLAETTMAASSLTAPAPAPSAAAPEAAAEGVLEELRTALRATSQAQNLVQQLLIFARGGAPIRQWIDPGLLVSGWLDEWTGLADVEYCLTAPAGTWLVEWDRHQMRRVLANLVRNAEQALTIGGLRRITISLRQSSRPWPLSWESSAGTAPEAAWTSSPDDQGGFPSAQAPDSFQWAISSASGNAEEFAPGAWLVLEVSDTGSGMDASVLAHALDPYFTTRDDRNASGIGLTVCEAIIKAHGGVLKIHSQPGEGARVRTAFPISALDGPAASPEILPALPPPSAAPTADLLVSGPAATTNPPSAPSAPACTAGFRALILEDEPLIRRLLLRHLQTMGAEVTSTAEGSETVRAYAAALAAGTRFDLVIMDLSIPGGMGGAQAMEQIRALDPEVTAIVSSGYSDDPVMSRRADYGFRAVLPKPWQPQDLKAVVRGLLPAGVVAGL